MIHHIIFRVTSDESDQFGDIMDYIELDEDVDCNITRLPGQGLLEFDFGIDSFNLPVPTLGAARSAACVYLLQGLMGLNSRYGEAHFESYPDCNDFGWCDHQMAA